MGDSISKRTNILMTAIALVGVGSSGSSVSAQYRQADAQLEEITIIGSRIRQTDGMVTPVPIAVMTTTELASFEPAGTIAVPAQAALGSGDSQLNANNRSGP